jgi:hypothetical protein
MADQACGRAVALISAGQGLAGLCPCACQVPCGLVSGDCDKEISNHLVMGCSLYGQIDSVFFAECRYDLTLVEDADQRRKAKSSAQRAQHRDFVQQQAQIEELANEYVGMWRGQAESESDDGEAKSDQTQPASDTEAEQEAASRSRGG